MRHYFLSLGAILCLFSSNAIAQFQDNFSDLNLEDNPVWQGEIVKFINTSGQQLRLMDSNATGSAYLSTASAAIEDAVWELEVQLDFNPSGSNYLKVYLTSDSPDLNTDLQGYYLKIGGTEDEISLYRQEGATSTKIIDGIDDRLDQTTNHLRLRVTRNLAGHWELYEDSQLDDQFQLIGQSEDNQIAFSAYFGIFCKYTSTRSDKFYFDNILVTGSPYTDQDPPTVKNIKVVDSQHLVISFNETIAPSSGNDMNSFLLSGQQELISSATNDSINWEITLPTGISNGQYLDLILNGLEDLNGNQLFDTLNFLYYYPEQVLPRDLVINELFPDPEPIIGLPATEFIEVYNNSEKAFMLSDWILTDLTSEVLLPSVLILPYEYIVFYPPDYVDSLPVNGFQLAAWPSLNNSGDSILLIDPHRQVVDLMAYNTSWYHDELKDGGGWSLEQINPDHNCATVNNWTASVNISGGTPGQVNSVYDLTPDLEGPVVVSISATGPAQLMLQLDEPVDFPHESSHIFSFDPPNRVLEINASGSASYLLSLEDSLPQEQQISISIDSIFDCNHNKMQLFEGQLFYDTQPPEVSAWKIYSDQQVQITTSEICDPDFDVIGDLLKGKPESLDGFNFLLTFEEPFHLDEQYQVEFTGLTDSTGNLNPDTIDIQFTFFTQLDSIVVTGQNCIDVYFEKMVDPDSATKLQNYHLDHKNNPFLALIDNDDPKLMHLFFEDNLEEGRQYKLFFEAIYDLDLQPLVLPAATFYFDQHSPALLNAEFLSDSTILMLFDEPLSAYQAELTSNYELNGLGMPSKAYLSSHEVLLFFPFKVPAETDIKLSVSGLSDLAGNTMVRTKNVLLQYDLLPPAIIDHYVLSSHLVTLTTSEGIDSVSRLPENFYLEELGRPDSVHFDDHSNKIYLIYSEPVPSRDSLKLSIFQLKDEAGHGYSGTNTIQLNTSDFTLSSYQVWSENILLLQFSKALSGESLSKSNFRYNHQNHPDSVYFLAGEAGKVVIEFNDSLSFTENNLLTISELKDISGGSKFSDSLIFSYFNLVESVITRYPNEVEINYSYPLPETVISQLDAFQLSDGQLNTNPVKAIVNSEINKLQLFFPYQFVADLIYTLSQDPLQLDFERWLPAHEAEVYLDQQQPAVINSQVLAQKVILDFSESLMAKTVTAPGHYVLNEAILPLEIQFEGNRVELLFAEEIDSLETSSLTITKIQDLHQNTIVDTTLYFQFTPPYQVKPGDLIITEIMVDPTPVVGLSEHQYVEIFNNSDEKVMLNQLLLGDQRDLVALPSFELNPLEYCVLVPDDYIEVSGLIQFIKLEQFPYFNLSGDSVTLIDQHGEFIDLLVYDTEYYHSEIHSNGGYSIEKIHLTPQCEGIDNWHASENALGGTPGEENSVAGKEFPNQVFAFDQVELIGDDMVQLLFNGQLDQAALSFENLHVSDLTIQEFWSEGQSLSIKFSQNIHPGQLYQLELLDLPLCSGDIIEQLKIPFGKGVVPSFNDLIVSELMVKPGGMDLMQHEYIEVYNASDQLLALEGLSFGDEKDMTNFPATFLAPAEYLVLTTTSGVKSMSVENAVSVSGWPGFNDEGQVIVRDQSENMIYQLDYDLNRLEPEEKTSGGWSMEIMDLKNPCHFENNWTFSIHPTGGTPGIKNSAYAVNEDRIAPHLDEIIALTPRLLQLTFDESLIPSVFKVENLTINPTVGVKDWKWIHSNQLQIKLVDSLKHGVAYNCILQGIKDCAGNYLQEEFHPFFLPQEAVQGDVIINEVLFEPFSGGVEFVEIFNSSEKVIDIYHWTFNTNNEYNQQNRIESHLLIKPEQLLVFTSDPDRLLSDYPKGKIENFRVLSSIPSFSNESDTVFLFDGQKRWIDKVFYHTDFHSPLIDQPAGVSLERINTQTDALNHNNWHSAAATIGFASPGYLNSSTRKNEHPQKYLQVEPVVLSPDQDGYQDFSRLTYSFDQPGKKGSMLILDARGRIVKKIFENQTLATSGTEIWQGENEQGLKVPHGYYILWLEVIDTNGTRELYKEKMVVTGR